MSIKIANKIVGYEVVKPEEEIAVREEAKAESQERQSATIIRMTERVARPDTERWASPDNSRLNCCASSPRVVMEVLLSGQLIQLIGHLRGDTVSGISVNHRRTLQQKTNTFGGDQFT